MKHATIKIAIILTFGLSIIFFCFSAVPALAAETDTSKIFDEIKNIKPSPKVELPGLNFSQEPKVVEEGGTTYLYIPYFGEYMAAIYKYAVIVAGILSVVIIMFGGFTWLTSGGSPEKITEAKKYIVGAITGLIIASGSYALLYTINPNLVQFKSLKVAYNMPKTIEDVVGDLTQDLSPLDETFTPSPTANVPLFKQWKNPWRDSPFGACGTVKSSGCGPTSLAMVLKKYGYDVNPAIMAQEWASLGYRKCPSPAPTDDECSGCGNTGHGGMFTDKTFLEKYKMKSSSLGTNKDSIIKTLQSGKPVIASMSKSIFTANAHFIVLTGINADGTIAVNDPNKSIYCSNEDKQKKGFKDICSQITSPIQSANIPANLVFPFLKAATLIEPK